MKKGGNSRARMTEAAREDLVAALRTQALVRALVQRTAGLAEGANYETAVDWVHGSFRHHRFGSTDGHAVSRECAEFSALLRRHSDHAKADAMDALLCRLLKVAPGMRASDTAAKPLSVLYWLADSEAMLASDPARWAAGAASLSPASSDKHEVAGLELLAGPVHWGYSSASAEEDDDEWTEGSAGAAPATAGAAMQARAGADPTSAVGQNEAVGAAQATALSPAEERAAEDDLLPSCSSAVDARLSSKLRLSRRPSELPHGGALLAAARDAGRPSRARLLYATVMAMAGCVGGDWEEVASATVNEEQSYCEGPRGEARAQPAAAWWRVVRLSVAGRAHAARCGEPSGAAPVLAELGESASSVATLGALSHALLTQPNLPTTLRALGQGLHEEVLRAKAAVWRGHDYNRLASDTGWSNAGDLDTGERTRSAHGARQAASGASRCGGGSASSSSRLAGLLALSDASRGTYGSRRRLAELTSFAAELAALPCFSALLGTTSARTPDSAAEATAAVLSLLMRRCEWHEAVGAPRTRDGAPLFFWLALLLRCVLSYARALGGWLQHGVLQDAPGELFVYRRGGSSGLDDAEGVWEGAYALRGTAAVPELLRHLAPSVLVAGKSRHLVGTLPDARSGGQGTWSSVPTRGFGGSGSDVGGFVRGVQGNCSQLAGGTLTGGPLASGASGSATVGFGGGGSGVGTYGGGSYEQNKGARTYGSAGGASGVLRGATAGREGEEQPLEEEVAARLLLLLEPAARTLPPAARRWWGYPQVNRSTGHTHTHRQRRTPPTPTHTHTTRPTPQTPKRTFQTKISRCYM